MINNILYSTKQSDELLEKLSITLPNLITYSTMPNLLLFKKLF